MECFDCNEWGCTMNCGPVIEPVGCTFKTAMDVARSNSRRQSNDWIVIQLDADKFTSRKALEIEPEKPLPAVRVVAAYRNGRKLYQHI